MSITASAAAHATGLPPNVVPWLPGSSRVAAAPMPIVAPIGTPPPSPLARVTTSGTTPDSVCASQAPVRPTPVCTSSTQSSAPCRVVTSLVAARNPGGGTTTPASPCIGSTITAAVLSSTAAARAPASPYGTKVTSPGSGSNGSR